MDEYMVERFTTNCTHCGKTSIHQERWIDFGQSDKHTYKCGYCGEITRSTWTFAHGSIVGLFLKIDKKPCLPDEIPSSFFKYP